MIMKLTESKDLFVMMETREEIDWYNTQKIPPMGISIILSNHINDSAEEFYNENMGNQLWLHLKK